MKFKVFLISALTLVSSAKVFAACYGAGNVGAQASQVAFLAEQLADSLYYTSAHQARNNSIELARLAQNLSQTANEYSVNCNLLRNRHYSITNIFNNLQFSMQYTRDRNANADFSYLRTEFHLLNQLVAEVQSSRRVIHPPLPPRRVYPRAHPPRRVIVHPAPSRRVVVRPAPSRRVQPAPSRRAPTRVIPGHGPRRHRN